MAKSQQSGKGTSNPQSGSGYPSAGNPYIPGRTSPLDPDQPLSDRPAKPSKAEAEELTREEESAVEEARVAEQIVALADGWEGAGLDRHGNPVEEEDAPERLGVTHDRVQPTVPTVTLSNAQAAFLESKFGSELPDADETGEVKCIKVTDLVEAAAQLSEEYELGDSFSRSERLAARTDTRSGKPLRGNPAYRRKSGKASPVGDQGPARPGMDEDMRTPEGRTPSASETGDASPS